MIKAVVFDLDNTLYAYDPCHAAGFCAVTDYAAAHFGVGPEQFRALHREGDRLLRAHAGENAAVIHSRLIRYQLILEGLGQPIFHAPRMEQRYWDAFFAEVKPEPGVRETLETLRERGFRIGVGTNMTAAQQYEKLRLLGLLEAVDFLVSSEEVNAEKPDTKLFLRCVEKAGIDAGECLFVGDDPERDIRGALAAGMPAVWLRRRDAGEAPEGVPVIEKLDALPALLTEMQ